MHTEEALHKRLSFAANRQRPSVLAKQGSQLWSEEAQAYVVAVVGLGDGGDGGIEIGFLSIQTHQQHQQK